MQASFSYQDQQFMRMAIGLAARAGNNMHPNPLVGAVIVKDGRVIGSGAHEVCGSLHAERNALKSCTEDPKGADIYVTLEPCCHQGKQPPCTQALIDAGIARCYIGSSDPNPLVSGKGAAILKQAGIQVYSGLLKEECDALNPAFFHFMHTHRPLITLKYAMSLDGKIACYTGKSQWITGEQARSRVALRRAAHMAVLTSVSTVTADDPLLTCHGKSSPDPIRIICDSHLRTPLSSRVLNDIPSSSGKYYTQEDSLPAATTHDGARYPRTILATCESSPEAADPYLEKGASVIVLPADSCGHVDLNALMTRLGEMDISSLYTECGADLLGSLLDEHLADRAEIYIAPKILGNKNAKPPVGGQGCGDPVLAFTLCPVNTSKIGEDLLTEGLIQYPDTPQEGAASCSQES